MNQLPSRVPALAGSRDVAAIGSSHHGGNDRLDLTESFAFFSRRKMLVLGTVCVVMLAALIASLVMPKTYRAHSVVMLTSDVMPAGQGAPNQNEQAVISNQVVETQVEVIGSRDMAERVAADLAGNDQLEMPEDYDLPPEDLIGLLQYNVSAQRNAVSYALTIDYDASSAKDAALIANLFAENYTDWELQADQLRNTEARTEIESRLSQLRVQAQADTQALQQYRINNNLLSTSGASLTEQEITNYEQEVARARAEAAEAAARLSTARSQLRSGSSGDDVGEALGSTVISALRTQEAQLAGQVASLSARYGPSHPELIRTSSQLEEVRQRIQAEIGRVVSNLDAAAAVSNQRLASLNGSLSSARSKLSQNNAAMVGLSELQRSAEASQQIYETYLNSYKQLLAAEGTERPSAQILSRASVPIDPISPNLKLNLALALVIGLGLGVLLSYIVESLFQGVTSPEEVEDATGLRVLASIPLLASVESRQTHAIAEVRDEPYSAFTESFRALGTSIDLADNRSSQVVAITSALQGEGKTVISCCLSHVYAASGLKTILIDCDLRRRGISRVLDLRDKTSGLIEVLQAKSKLNFNDLDRDFVFWTLPLVQSDSDGEHLLTGQPFIDLLDQLRENFDRIVLDLPPVLPISYARILASRADSVVLAAHWRNTSTFALRAALNRLPEDQVHVAGVALSQVDLRRRAYFKRLDPSFYYNQYREYYS